LALLGRDLVDDARMRSNGSSVALNAFEVPREVESIQNGPILSRPIEIPSCRDLALAVQSVPAVPTSETAGERLE